MTQRQGEPRAAPVVPRAVVLLVGAASVVVAIAGVKAVAWLLSPVLLALVIVLTIAPVHRWLIAHRIPSWLATIVLVLLVYGLIAVLGVVLIVSVAQLATLLPQYANRFDALIGDVTGVLAKFGVGKSQIGDLAHSADFSKLAAYAGSFLSGVTGVVTSLVFLLALLLFLSVEANGFDERMALVAAERPNAAAALGEFAGKTRRYLAVTTVFGFIVAVLDTIALLVLGVPVALLWGLLSFVTNYIPNVGFILGLIPPALLALLSGGWQLMVIVIAVYCVLNLVVQSLIQPYYVGDAVGLSAVMTFLALIFWTWVLGPLGAILAVPMTLLVRTTLIDIDPRAGWVATLLNLSSGDTGGKRRTRKTKGEDP
jgi:AI-2 transport protein TqsA